MKKFSPEQKNHYKAVASHQANQKRLLRSLSHLGDCDKVRDLQRQNAHRARHLSYLLRELGGEDHWPKHLKKENLGLPLPVLRYA